MLLDSPDPTFAGLWEREKRSEKERGMEGREPSSPVS